MTPSSQHAEEDDRRHQRQTEGFGERSMRTGGKALHEELREELRYRASSGLNRNHNRGLTVTLQDLGNIGEFVGSMSFNYTGPATRLNDENIIILGDLEAKKKSSITAQKKLAKYALDEIDRIIRTYGKKL